MHTIFDERLTGFTRGIDRKVDMVDLQKIRDRVAKLEEDINKIPANIENINNKISVTEDKLKSMQNDHTEKAVENVKQTAINNRHDE